MTININRPNTDPIEVGIVLLIVGIIVVLVLATVSGGGGTADPGELRTCLGRGVGVVSHLYGFSGEPSDARTSFALTGNAAVDVFVMQDSGAAEDAASHASTAGGSARASSSENVMWLTLGSETYDSRIRTCIGEAS
ncbi:MAG: hypothetical protein WBZ00_14830 [Solirubrobacterales bacterium]